MSNSASLIRSTEGSEQSVPHLDRAAAQRWLKQTRRNSPWLNEEAAARLLDRLACIKGVPQTWVNWGPAWGGLLAHQTLLEQWPGSTAYAVDIEGMALDAHGGGQAKPTRWNPLNWLASKSAPLAAQPPENTVDMVWANMLLHLAHQPQTLLRQWQRLLKVGGFVMFSGLGPDTLKELRQVHQAMGWPEPMHPLTDMHDWGDMLVELGFSEPVMDVDRFKLTYPSAERMLQDLREWGRNLHDERFPALRARAWRSRWIQAVEQHGARNTEGYLTLSVEMVFGHAIKTLPKMAVAPELVVGLDEMREQLRSARTRPS